MIRLALAAAGMAFALFAAVAWVAFPPEVTKTVRVPEVEGMVFVKSSVFTITPEWNQVCELYESSAGVAQGTVDLKEGQKVVQTCVAVKAGPKG